MQNLRIAADMELATVSVDPSASPP